MNTIVPFLGKGSVPKVLSYPDYGEIEKNLRHLKMYVPNFYQALPLMINGLGEIPNDYIACFNSVFLFRAPIFLHYLMTKLFCGLES